jgi:hypothetical protein
MSTVIDATPIPIDRFTHTNPAFVAACLHWVAAGYQEQAEGRVTAPRFLSLVWASLTLVLLAPVAVRKRLPLTAAARLAHLFQENAEWRFAATDAMHNTASPFWAGVAFGIASKTLALETLRLRATGRVSRPSEIEAIDLRRRALVFGRILAREGLDRDIALAVGVAVYE